MVSVFQIRSNVQTLVTFLMVLFRSLQVLKVREYYVELSAQEYSNSSNFNRTLYIITDST